MALPPGSARQWPAPSYIRDQGCRSRAQRPALRTAPIATPVATPVATPIIHRRRAPSRPIPGRPSPPAGKNRLISLRAAWG
ncbi:MAG TPA: hypothetical protein PKL62_15660, partial [Accumulibacter sp.]|nr:hypothetical protein [Accumulibacter sp.]